MKKIIAILLILTFSGCATVVPIEPSPEELTLTEAEKAVKHVVTSLPYNDNFKIDDWNFSFENLRESKNKRVPFSGIYKTVAERGFASDVYYYSALVTIYYQGKDLNMEKVSIECKDIKQAETFISALAKLSQYAKKNQGKRFDELRRAYKKGILTREEYLQKKEKFERQL